MMSGAAQVQILQAIIVTIDQSAASFPVRRNRTFTLSLPPRGVRAPRPCMSRLLAMPLRPYDGLHLPRWRRKPPASSSSPSPAVARSPSERPFQEWEARHRLASSSRRLGENLRSSPRSEPYVSVADEGEPRERDLDHEWSTTTSLLSVGLCEPLLVRSGPYATPAPAPYPIIEVTTPPAY